MLLPKAEYFCLRWNEYEKNMSDSLKEVQENSDFCDVTLACDDDQIEAHRLVLSSCSPLFKTILRRNQHNHPLLYLKGVKMDNLKNLLRYMYYGEVNVEQVGLPSFLETAEELKIKGLVQKNKSAVKRKSSESDGTLGNVKRKKEGGKLINCHLNKSNVVTHTEDSLGQLKSVCEASSEAEVASEISDDLEDMSAVSIKAEPDVLDHDLDDEEVDFDEKTDNDMSNDGLQVEPEFNDENLSFKTESFECSEEQMSLDINIDEEMNNGGLSSNSTNKEKFDKVKEIVAVYMNFQPGGIYSCKICSKITKNRTHLQEHIEAKHIKGRLYECDLCGRSLNTSATLRLHRRKCPQIQSYSGGVDF